MLRRRPFRLGVSEFLSTGKLDTFVSDASGNFLHIPPAYWGGFHAYRPLAGAGFCADADLHGSLAGEVDGRPIFIEEVHLRGLAAAPPADVPVRMRPQVSGPALKEWVGKKIKETWGFPGPAATKGRPVTNVRNLASPFWRSALSNVERRCIVPVTRFCEWTAEPDPETKRKRKVWFGMHEDHEPLFAFAGLWRPAEGGPFMAFLTCEPNQTVGAIHPKAMPVILGRDDLDSWLSDPHETACSLARPYNDDLMRVVD